MKLPIASLSIAAALSVALAAPAAAHVGVGETGSFLAGVLHPIGGLDHILAMVVVGLWAALQGGRSGSGRRPSSG